MYYTFIQKKEPLSKILIPTIFQSTNQDAEASPEKLQITFFFLDESDVKKNTDAHTHGVIYVMCM